MDGSRVGRRRFVWIATCQVHHFTRIEGIYSTSTKASQSPYETTFEFDIWTCNKLYLIPSSDHDWFLTMIHELLSEKSRKSFVIVHNILQIHESFPLKTENVDQCPSSNVNVNRKKMSLICTLIGIHHILPPRSFIQFFLCNLVYKQISQTSKQTGDNINLLGGVKRICSLWKQKT